MAGPGPTMSTSDSSRLMSITWPSPVRSRWRSAASTAKAPRMPVTSSARAIGGRVGGPVRLAGGVRQRGHAFSHGAEPGAVGVGAGLPVAGHPQHHQAGVLRQQHRLGVEAQPLQRPGPEVLDQHVGAAHQSQQHLAPLRRLQIDLDRPLVPAHLAPVEAVLSVALAQVAGAVTGVRPLHLDHVCAEVGQMTARGRAGEDGGQVEDDQAGQWTMAGCAHGAHPRARGSTNP